MLSIKSFQALPVPDEPLIVPMHQVYVLLQVCPSDMWVLDGVQRWWGGGLGGIVCQAPEATACLTSCTWIIDNGGKRLPDCVHAAVYIRVSVYWMVPSAPAGTDRRV